MSVEKVYELAQGRVYTGLEAKNLGLVDVLGGLQRAFTEAKKLAGLDPKKLYALHRYKASRLSLQECLENMTNMLRCVDQAKELDTDLWLPVPNQKARLVAKRARRWLGMMCCWIFWMYQAQCFLLFARQAEL